MLIKIVLLNRTVQVVVLYWMGGAGHFGMGNTNTLATVDVAGAYIVRKSVEIFVCDYMCKHVEVHNDLC